MLSLPAMYMHVGRSILLLVIILFPRKVQGIIRNDDQSLSPVAPLVRVLFLSFLVP